MSKGTPFRAVRIPPDLMERVELTIARRNEHTRAEPWDVSKFIRVALERAIRKMERSRAPRRPGPRRAAQPAVSPDPLPGSSAIP